VEPVGDRRPPHGKHTGRSRGLKLPCGYLFLCGITRFFCLFTNRFVYLYILVESAFFYPTKFALV
jgi:hypothetical protein